MPGGMLRGGPHGKFVHICFGQDNRARFTQPLYGKGIIRRHEILKNPGTRRAGNTSQRQSILDTDRHTPQRGFLHGGHAACRARGIQRPCLFQRLGIAPGQKRAQTLLGGVHACKAGRGQVFSPNISRAQKITALPQADTVQFAHALPSTILGTRKNSSPSPPRPGALARISSLVRIRRASSARPE